MNKNQKAVARQILLAAYLLSSDGWVYYTDPAWAAKRVMRYLGEAVVLEPEELRQEVHRQSAALLETYGDSV